MIISYILFTLSGVIILLQDEKSKKISIMAMAVNLITILLIYLDPILLAVVGVGLLTCLYTKKADILYFLITSYQILLHRVETMLYVPCLLYMLIGYIVLRKDEKIPYLVIIVPISNYLASLYFLM